MSRELAPEEGARYEAMLPTIEGKETVAKNLNRLIRQRVTEQGSTFSAYVADHVLPAVAGNRDATIFVLTVLMDVAVEESAGRRRMRRSRPAGASTGL